MLLDEFIVLQKNLLELERTEEINRSKLLTECSPKVLEGKNLCIRKLSLINVFTGLYGRTILEFESKINKEDTSRRVFSQGDIIGVYSDSSNSVSSKTLATGLFYKSNRDAIQIALDDNLDTDKEMMNDFANGLYRLVKLSSEVTYSRLKAGLKYLENRTKPFCGDYLIDLFLGSNSIAVPTCEKEIVYINENLNKSQKDAVKFVLSRPDIAIVHGPPGTGKTTVAVEIINQILESRNSHKVPKILVCTPSNIALDNLAEKLLTSKSQSASSNQCGKSNKGKVNKWNLLRLGHSARVMPHLTDISLDCKLSNCDQSELIAQVRLQIDSILKKRHEKSKNRYELSDLRKELRDRESKAIREVLNSSHVILSTLTGLKSNKSLPLNELEFDVVLIDEASQAIEAACWLAIPRGRKLILAGDHKQLPPTVLSDEASKQGLAMSLMERLLNLYPGKEITRMLSCQYRMHQDIMGWSSTMFYNSELTADLSVAQHALKDYFTDAGIDNGELAPITFIDTAGCDLYELESTQEDSKANLGEAQLAAVYIQQIVDRFRLQPQHIGVITPYSRQVQLVKEAVRNKMGSCQTFDCTLMEVSTVDGFQGREKEVIVTTLVRSNPTGTIGFLAEHRRLNVALTRAKCHLCVIGDSSTIEKSGDEVLISLVNYWNENAEVLSAHDYVYEHDITAGDCVKTTRSNKPKEPEKSHKPKIEVNVELENKVCEQLRTFHSDNKQKRLEFSPRLNARVRAILHSLADTLGLYHESVGEGPHRKLIVYRTPNKPETDVRAVSEPPTPELSEEDTQHAKADIDVKKDWESIGEKSADKLDKDSFSGYHTEIGDVTQVQQNELHSEIAIIHVADTSDFSDENKILQTELNKQPDTCSSSVLGQVLESKCAQLASVIDAKCSKPSGKPKREKNKNKPKNLQKSVNPSVTEIPDDLDEMFEHFQKMDKICQHTSKCSTLVSLVGFNCQFCKKRFCVYHSKPEVHMCPLANRMAWRNQESSHPKPMSNAKKIKHNQLSRVMNKKINELSTNRKPQIKAEN